jgi:predicted Zn-dependent protease with MMP-like domain
MSDAKKLNMVLAIIAAAILALSFSAFAYTQIPKGDADLVTVNGIDFAWDEVFADYEIHTFTAIEQDFEGVSLEEIVLDSSVQNPESQTYRLTGIDGYQKDVEWNDIQNGYLTLDKHRAVFPNMTQSFWVRDLASIEVV